MKEIKYTSVLMPETTVRSFKYDMMSKYNFTYITQQINCLYWHSYV